MVELINKESKLKTILKILTIFLFSHITLYGGIVKAKVDSKKIEVGDSVTLSLSISGEDITKPSIQKICDSEIISTSTQTNMQIINGSVSKSFTLNYTFVPQKSCRIEPIEVEVDNKIEKSEPIEIEVANTGVRKDADFILTLSSDKKELFVGEPFELTFTFKQKREVDAVDLKFFPPEFNGFWVKSQTQPQRSQDAKEIITKIVYKMAPQRAGEFKISKAQIDVAVRSSNANNFSPWMPAIKWKSYFSNEIVFDIKPLPSGVALAGDFTLKASADKEEVDSNEPVNVVIDVIGEGNLEDIKSFKPGIEGVAVFDEKISIDRDVLTQKIAFVSERDFTIPSFSLTYFDTKTKEIKTVSTKEIAVHIKNAKTQEILNIKKEDSESQNIESKSRTQDSINSFFFFLSGLAIGVLIMFFIKKTGFKKEKKSSIKDPKTLLMKLLEFRDDEEVKKVIEILEKNIYQNQNIELDKESLNRIRSRYKF